MGIPMLTIRRSRDYLIFNMGSLTGKTTSLYWDVPPGANSTKAYVLAISRDLTDINVMAKLTDSIIWCFKDMYFNSIERKMSFIT